MGRYKTHKPRRDRAGIVIETTEDLISAGEEQAEEQKREAHIIETLSTKAIGYPERMLRFDVESHPQLDQPDRHALTMGWATFNTYKNRHKPIKEGVDSLEYTTPDQFMDFMEAHCTSREPLWIFAHNIAFDARIVNFTEQLRGRGWNPVGGEMFIPDPNGPFRMVFSKEQQVEYAGEMRTRTYTIILFDTGNWWGKTALAKLGEVLGFPKGDIDAADPKYWPVNGCVPGTAVFEELSEYCRRDVDIVAKLVDAWVDFCKSNRLGPCAMTLAGQAFTAFRARFMSTPIYIHDNQSVIKMEQEAMNGGLTNNFKVGRWKADKGEQLRVLDVKSMYPTIMAAMPVPVRLITHMRGSKIGADAVIGQPLSREGRIDWAHQMINSGYAAVARVIVRTEEPEALKLNEDPRYRACVPVLHDGKLLYPTGEFNTTLNTPDLLEGIRRGVITDITEVALYDQEIIFKDYVDYFFTKRSEYRSQDNVVMEAICKLFLNSLFGKFGQSTYRWDEIGQDVLDTDRAETFYDLDTDKVIHLRQIAGHTEMRSEDKAPSYNSFIAISGHITSYSRRYLLERIETAGYDHVGYCDTDSIFCDEIGYTRLVNAGHVAQGPAQLGQLEVELICDEMDLRTLKDYTCYGRGYIDKEKKEFVYDKNKPMIVAKERLKGVRRGAERGYAHGDTWTPDPNGPHYRQDQFQGIAGALREGNTSGAKITKVIKKPSHSYNKGIRMDDGTVLPLKIG